MKKAKRSKKIVITSCAILALVGCCITLFLGVKLIRHERNQANEIADLRFKFSTLEDKISALISNEAANQFAQVCNTGGGYNYLAIGNSITYHVIADVWWAEDGMAATKPENDYFHLVSSHLVQKYGDVNSMACNGGHWELLYTDRAETLSLLDPYLNANLDLVTVQLGENATELTTFESDFEYLIQYIQEAAPDAQIIIVGDFWNYDNRDELKKAAAEACGVIYISLEEIKEDKKYQCGLGTVVYGDDGREHIVEHFGVARHPGDAGMRYIADMIIKEIG